MWGSHWWIKLHPNGISLTSIISRDKEPSSPLPLFLQLTQMCADGAVGSLPVINPAERSWSRSGTQAQRDTVRADLTNANPLYPFPEWIVIVSRLKCAGEATKTKTWQQMWMCARLWLLNSFSWRWWPAEHSPPPPKEEVTHPFEL